MTKTEHAVELTELCPIQFRLVVHEVSTQQSSSSDIFWKDGSWVKKMLSIAALDQN